MRLATAPDKGFDKRAGESAEKNARALSSIQTPARQNLCRRYNARSGERRYAQQEARAEHTQWLCPQRRCKGENLNKNAAFTKGDLTHCCEGKGARRKPCRESYFLFLGTVRMGEDIPSEGEQPPSQEQSQEQSLPNAAMSMSAAHTSRLHEDTSHT